jgi:hypothetical protein
MECAMPGPTEVLVTQLVSGLRSVLARHAEPEAVLGAIFQQAVALLSMAHRTQSRYRSWRCPAPSHVC